MPTLGTYGGRRCWPSMRLRSSLVVVGRRWSWSAGGAAYRSSRSVSPILPFLFCRSRTDVDTIRTYVHPWSNVHGREGNDDVDDTRHSRHACAEETIEPRPSLSFSRAVGRASSRRLFLSVSLSLSPLVPAARLFLSGLAAKLNKHSYLHSISGALTSLDNPATDSSSSHVRASSIL